MRGDHPGNDTAIDPESYLKSLKGAAGGNGADAAKCHFKSASYFRWEL